jgi:hypothetical protein
VAYFILLTSSDIISCSPICSHSFKDLLVQWFSMKTVCQGKALDRELGEQGGRICLINNLDSHVDVKLWMMIY